MEVFDMNTSVADTKREPNLLAALADHSFRAITFRHSGAGLSRITTRVMVVCIALSAMVAFARWGIPGQAVVHALVILLLAAAISPRLAAGCALLSIGVDSVAVPVEALAGGEVRAFFWWEIAAGLYLVFRMARNGLLR